MADLVLTCAQCGHEMLVPEYAMGSKGRCAQCRAVLVVDEQSTRPLESADGAGAGVSEKAPPATSDGGACAFCGRPFRGEWDRHSTPEGIICHICARQSSPSGPAYIEAATFQEAPRDPTAYFPHEPVGRTVDLDEKVPFFARNHPELFRTIVLFAGLAVVGLGLLMFFLQGADVPRPSPHVAQTHQPAPSHGPTFKTPPTAAAKVTTLILVAFFCFFGCLLALYLTLRIENKLPLDHFFTNAAALSPFALLLAVPTFFRALIMVAATVVTGLGGPLLLLQLILSVMIMLWVLWVRFDCPVTSILLYFVLHVFTAIFAQQLAVFVTGLLGNFVF